MDGYFIDGYIIKSQIFIYFLLIRRKGQGTRERKAFIYSLSPPPNITCYIDCMIDKTKDFSTCFYKSNAHNQKERRSKNGISSSSSENHGDNPGGSTAGHHTRPGISPVHLPRYLLVNSSPGRSALLLPVPTLHRTFHFQFPPFSQTFPFARTCDILPPGRWLS